MRRIMLWLGGALIVALLVSQFVPAVASTSSWLDHYPGRDQRYHR